MKVCELLATALWKPTEAPRTSDYDKLRALPGEMVNYGGCTFLTRNLYDRLGGFDERYIGWGAEDSDFYQRAELIGANVLLRDKECVPVHLSHAPQPLQPECYKRNLQMLEALMEQYKSGEAVVRLPFARVMDD